MDAYERMEATLREIKRKHKAVLDDREDEARRLFNNNDDLEDEVARLKGQINGLEREVADLERKLRDAERSLDSDRGGMW